MARCILPQTAHYSEASEALGLVKPRPDVLEKIRDSVHVCVACNTPPAPLGFGNELAYSDWLKERARKQPRDMLKNRVALRLPQDDCAGCLSQVSLVIGIPDNLLSRILAGLSGQTLKRITLFMAANFVFPICGRCLASEAERVRLSSDEIMKRYRRVLKALHGTERTRAGTGETEAEVFRLIGQAIRERDAA